MDRCDWPGDHELMISYHDTEYGFLVTDDAAIFERLMLEAYQAGLSWRLVLEKREGFKSAFHNFNIEKVASMKDEELEKLREDPSIIRNKLKIYATRNNAQVTQKIIKKFGSLLDYFQQFEHEVDGDPKNNFKPIVKKMKKDGFKFVGPMILDEFYKSIGLNPVEHQEHCFLYNSQHNRNFST